MTPADLRALAVRVLSKETSLELETAVLEAMGWEYIEKDHLWAKFVPPDDYENRTFVQLPRPYASHDDAFAAIPEGWRLRTIAQTDDGYVAKLGKGTFSVHNAYTPVPDLPRALTAISMIARAVDLEDERKATP